MANKKLQRAITSAILNHELCTKEELIERLSFIFFQREGFIDFLSEGFPKFNEDKAAEYAENKLKEDGYNKFSDWEYSYELGGYGDFIYVVATCDASYIKEPTRIIKRKVYISEENYK